ncbi:MAG: 4'-phosphopantetheinyl transferase superfamily protein [Lachnospiraceae bacterium]|nr:4'-phosphopantetheinyl transferase superfamily protein [Lachnospiraceae bacterium]
MFLRVYFTDVTPLTEDAVFEEYYREAIPERRTKVDAFKLKMPKCRSLAAGALLKKALSDAGLSGTDYHIETTETGKPILKGAGASSVFFNLSHSGERAMCVISDCPVGCDVETVKEKTRNVADRYFTESEAKLVAENSEIFTRLWTLKESFVKTTGEGLARPLDSFSFDFDETDAIRGVEGDGIEPGTYSFYEWNFNDGYWYAACVQGQGLTPEVEWVDLSSVQG